MGSSLVGGSHSLKLRLGQRTWAGQFGLKGLPGLESIWQLGAPDLPDAFPPLRLETPARVVD